MKKLLLITLATGLINTLAIRCGEDEVAHSTTPSFPIEEEIVVEVVGPDYHRSDIDFDYDLQDLLWDACEQTGLEYELALAVIHQETRFQNVMGDGGNSYGYMQIQPRWHYARMEKWNVTDLNDPYSNFIVGCDLLSELIEKYGIEGGLTAYNTGKSGTSKYATSVMNKYAEYKGGDKM